MKTTWERIKLLVILYPIYWLAELVFQGLRLFGRVKVVRSRNQSFSLKKTILVANHPSFLEPVLVPLIFFRKYALHPIRLLPWNVPEKSRFYDPWFFAWSRCHSIPVDRQDKSLATNKATLQKMKQVLRQGQPLILFAEGGRTFNGKEFSYSPKGKRLRKLQKGVAWLIKQTGAKVLPIWIDGSDKVFPYKERFPKFWRARIIIKIGNPLLFPSSISQEAILEKITTALLELADQ